jgi:hypothetical protein
MFSVRTVYVLRSLQLALGEGPGMMRFRGGQRAKSAHDRAYGKQVRRVAG